jgi:hypothetical protein
MDEFNMVKDWGWAGLVVYVAVKYGHIFWKKQTGRYYSWAEFKERLDTVEGKLQTHSTDFSRASLSIALLEKDNSYMKEQSKEIKEDVKNIYDILGQIKNMLIEQRKR